MDSSDSNPRWSLLRFLGIQQHEATLAGVMFVYSLAAVGGTYVIGRTVAQTLFLSRIPAASLPWTYLGTALSVCLATLFYSRLAHRMGPDKLVVGSSIVFTSILIGLRWSLVQWPDAVLVMGALHLAVEAICPITVIQFWVLAGELFHAREAKRLFGVIAAGGVLSNVLFGGLIRCLAPAVGIANFLYLTGALLLICAGCAVFAGGRISPVSQKPDRESSIPEGWRRIAHDVVSIFHSGHLRNIALMLGLMAIACNLFDYQWKIIVQQRYGGNESTMAEYFGNFYIVSGMAAFLIQTLATRWILTRLGISVALLGLPLLMAVATGLIVAAHSSSVLLSAVTFGKLAEVALRYTLYDAAVQLLYLSLASRFRARVKPLIDGGVRTLCVAFVGAALLILAAKIPVTRLSWGLLPLLLVWIAMVWPVRRGYVRSLANSLRSRRYHPQASPLNLDAAAETVLRQALESNDSIRCVNALELAKDFGIRKWTSSVLLLLESPDPTIRAAAVDFLDASPGCETWQAVAGLSQDDSPEVRLAVAKCLAFRREDELRDALRNLLHDNDADVRAEVVAGWLQHGPPAEQELARQSFTEMVDSQKPEFRAAAAAVIARTQDRRLLFQLTRLLEDSHPQVLSAAMTAAATCKLPAVLPQLIQATARRPTAVSACRAIPRYGDLAVPHLVESAKDPDRDHAVRTALPAILEQIGTPAAIQGLWELCRIPDEFVRGRVLFALSRLATRIGQFSFDGDAIWKQCKVEIQLFRKTQTIVLDLADSLEGSLLGDRLAYRALHCQKRLMDLISLVDARLSSQLIQWAVFEGSPRDSANALELIENCLPHTWKTATLSVLERQTPSPPAPSEWNAVRVARWKDELLDDPDPWIVAATAWHFQLTDAWTLDEWLVCDRSQRDGRQTLPFSLHGEVHLKAPHRREASMQTLSMFEKVLFLKSVSFLESIPSHELICIAKITREMDIEKDEVLIREGQLGDRLYLIIEGEFEVQSHGRLVAVLGPRDCVGEMAILDESPRSATIVARSDALLLTLDRDSFMELLSHYPEIAQSVIRLLCRRLRTALSGEPWDKKPVSVREGEEQRSRNHALH